MNAGSRSLRTATRSPHQRGARWQIGLWAAIASTAVYFAVTLASRAGTNEFEFREGGIIRGPTSQKLIALAFTGHTFAEGSDVIFEQLAKHHAHASFFLTGVFLENPQFEPLVRRMIKEGHYAGPHSDQHVLYCPWTGPKKSLVTRAEFEADLKQNLEKLLRYGIPRERVRYWLPSFEWYNEEIVEWSKAMGLTLVNFTPGTRANADYTEDHATNYVSSQVIFDSIVKKEKTDTYGLNGFILLSHVGVGPGRTDKMHNRLGELLDYLEARGYKFVTIDALLESK